MSRYEDAMFEQVTQLRFLLSQMGAEYTHGFELEQQDDHAPDDRMPDGYLYTIQRETLEQAEPVWVSPDVTEMIDVARETFEPEALLPTDPFTMAGFALLSRAILLDDNPLNKSDNPNDHLQIPVRAIAWLPMHDGTYERGCFWISFYTSAEDDITVGRGVDTRNLSPLARLTLVHQFQWSWHEKPWENWPAVWKDTPELLHARGMQQLKLVQVMWRLGSQLVPVREKAARPDRRDAKRHGLDRDKVTVIKLRREREPSYVGEPTDEGYYDHRFVVRGHWRNQWYATIEQHRQIWINPYVKGPEGTELRLTTRAFEFTR